MIERLFESFQASGRASRIDQVIRDRLLENGFANVVRTRERREHSIFREQLERADVQLPISAKGVAQAALGFRERRRIENDEVVFRAAFLRRAQERENVL